MCSVFYRNVQSSDFIGHDKSTMHLDVFILKLVCLNHKTSSTGVLFLASKPQSLLSVLKQHL